MYPHRELIRLGAHKAALRRRITARRAAGTVTAARVLRPLVWLDRLLGLWRRLSPFARYVALPLGLLLNRSPAPRRRLLGTLVRWAPLVLAAVRGHPAGRRA